MKTTMLFKQSGLVRSQQRNNGPAVGINQSVASQPESLCSLHCYPSISLQATRIFARYLRPPFFAYFAFFAVSIPPSFLCIFVPFCGCQFRCFAPPRLAPSGPDRLCVKFLLFAAPPRCVLAAKLFSKTLFNPLGMGGDF